MAGFTDAYENLMLDALLGVGFTKPASVAVALYTASPTDTGGGTEVSGGGYARVVVPNDATNWPNATAGQKKNGTAIVFPQATADWGAVTHFAVFDDAATPRMVGYGALATSMNVTTGLVPRFAANALVISLD